ncbi:hypothetical protein N9Y42_00715 [Mariniblastus sp.]|nr:hypothetical protein [Mariniblastus sp.]
MVTRRQNRGSTRGTRKLKHGSKLPTTADVVVIGAFALACGYFGNLAKAVTHSDYYFCGKLRLLTLSKEPIARTAK